MIMAGWSLVNIFDTNIDIHEIIKGIIKEENWEDSVQLEVVE